MKIVLVRHTSVALPKEVCYGYTDVPLKETFEEEATVVERNLEAMGIAALSPDAANWLPSAAILLWTTAGLWSLILEILR